MRIFITGATGFIGNKVVIRLAGSEHEVLCLVRKNNQDSQRLKSLGVKLIIGDITDKSSILRGMSGCDRVIHLAGLYSFWQRHNRLFKEVNVDGTRNVMEAALETKISKVVHVSTALIYGKPGESPFTENCREGPVRFGRYGRTKFKGDQIVWDLYKNMNLPVVVIYPCGVLGAGDSKPSGKYVSDLINRRLPATVLKNSILTWVHVKDVADAIVRAMEKTGNIGEKYLIGKQQLSMSEFNQMISEVSGVPLPFLQMPDFLTVANAYIFTALSRITGLQPPWGMSVDQIRTMKEGFRVDGSKAEKELELCYTSIRKALEEQIAAEMEALHPNLQPTV